MNVLFTIDIITKVIIAIIGFLVFKISWDAAKKKQGDVNIHEKSPYSPYDCDEETETLLILSIPILRVFSIGFSLFAVMEFIDYYYIHDLDDLILGICCVCGSLMFAWKPIRVIIAPDSIVLKYSFSFFTRTERIPRRDVSHIAYNGRRSFLGQDVTISIVRGDQMKTRILRLSSQNENSVINNSRVVLLRLSKILGVPIKSFRTA